MISREEDDKKLSPISERSRLKICEGTYKKMFTAGTAQRILNVQAPPTRYFVLLRCLELVIGINIPQHRSNAIT